MRSVYIKSVFGLMTVAAVSAFAAKPVATLSSVGPVIISGTEMSALSATFWPIANLDEISTLGSRAILILPDRSRITLSRHSKAKIESAAGRTKVTVLEGSGQYDLVTPNSATILVGTKVISAAAAQGKFENTTGGRRTSDFSDQAKEDLHKNLVQMSPDR